MSNKFVVRYRSESYDLSEFVKKHPGGSNTLSGILDADIDFKFDTSIPHSDAAKYLIREYKVRTKNGDECNNNQLDSERIVDKRIENDESMEVGSRFVILQPNNRWNKYYFRLAFGWLVSGNVEADSAARQNVWRMGE